MVDWRHIQFDPTMWQPAQLGGAGTNPPRVIFTNPPQNSVRVDPQTLVTIRVFDPDYDIDNSKTGIGINGTDAYAHAGGGFKNGYTGVFKEELAGWVISIRPPDGWDFNRQILVKTQFEDAAGHASADYLAFTCEDNPSAYSGVAPLALERSLQRPFETYLELEPLRTEFLGAALNPEKVFSGKNKHNKAARVIYQLAYSTELSTVLNPYHKKNKQALETFVLEQSRIVSIAKTLDSYKPRIRAAIESLHSGGIISREHLNAMVDYVDSLAFNYRVSLVANLLLLAKAVESNG